MGARAAQGVKALQAYAPQLQLRRPACRYYFHIDPADLPGPARAQRLESRLLGGKAPGKMHGAQAPRLAVSALAFSKHTPEKTLAVALNGLADTRNLDDIDTNSNYHTSGLRALIDWGVQLMEHFRIRERDGVKAIECVPLSIAGFVAAFSTRPGGVSPLPKAALNLGHFAADRAENVQENRRRFLATLELPTDTEIVTANQVHSADSHVVMSLAASRKERVKCDALLTNAHNFLLGIQTADCLPVLIVDPVKRALAGIHAGWRGTLSRIVEHSITRMRENFGTEPADCLVAMGPAIGRCCFEIGADVREPFEAQFAYGRDLFFNHQPNGKAHMDLRAANQAQLQASGVRAENIFVWQDCTRCNMDLYFSYRGESAQGAVGRLLSVVGFI